MSGGERFRRRAGWWAEYPPSNFPDLVPPPPSDNPPLVAALSREPLDRLNLLWQHGVKPVDPLQERAGFSYKPAEVLGEANEFPLIGRMLATAAAREEAEWAEALRRLVLGEPAESPEQETRMGDVLAAADRYAQAYRISTDEALGAFQRVLRGRK